MKKTNVLYMIMTLLFILILGGCDLVDKVDTMKDELDNAKETMVEIAETVEEATENLEEELDTINEEDEDLEEEAEEDLDEVSSEVEASADSETDETKSDEETTPETIENLEGAIIDYENVMIYVESVQIFEENESLGLPRLDHQNYFYITGEVNNKMADEVSKDFLYNIFVYDIDNNEKQFGDASSWLPEKTRGGIIDSNETQPFKRLYLFDKTVTGIQVELYDWQSHIYKTWSKDVSQLNEASVAVDESNEAAMREKVRAAADNIISLIDQDAFEEIAEFADSQVYVLPGPHIGFDEAVYIDNIDWATIPTYEEEVVWGYDPATGDPMSMQPMFMFDGFITHYDFLNAPEINVFHLNEKQDGYATWKSDIFFDYYVSYFYPGFNAEFDGIDYQNLILVFRYDEDNNTFILTGIANEYWTI